VIAAMTRFPPAAPAAVLLTALPALLGGGLAT